MNRFYGRDNSATGQMLCDLAEHLVRQGRRVVVITSRLDYRGGPRLPRRDAINGVDVRRVWSCGFGRSSLALRLCDYLSFYVCALVELLSSLRPGDVVLAKTDPPLISAPALLAARLKRAKLTNWLQDLFPETADALGVTQGGVFAAHLKVLRDWTLRAADLNAVLDESMAQRVRRRGVSLDRVRILANWADARIEPVAKRANAWRGALNVEDKLVIGYSGNLGRAHVANHIAALIETTNPIPDLVWLFIGGGAGMEMLKRRFKDDSRVLFRPYQPQCMLSQTLSAPDIHLVSLDPTCEGLVFPSKLYGVLAAGRPLLFLGSPEGSIGRRMPRELVLAFDEPAAWRDQIERVHEGWRATGEIARQGLEALGPHSSTLALHAWSAALEEVFATAFEPQTITPAVADFEHVRT